jgi:capsule polysaccharide export protein KpsE/RkpR
MSDRKRVIKARKKRIKSVKKQIAEHETKISAEEPVKDTTKQYWQKEIDEKFLKQLEKDKKYLGENNGNSDKKNS